MRKISIIFIGILALALLAGCRTAPETLPTDGPNTPGEQCDLVEFGVSGEILSIDVSDDGDILGIIEVKGEPDNGSTYDYGMVSVTPDTEIYGNDALAFSDLAVGMSVNVFFDGAVAESYPVQGTASQVNVVVNEDPVEE